MIANLTKGKDFCVSTQNGNLIEKWIFIFKNGFCLGIGRRVKKKNI
jgi:hypothetical protein